MKFSMGIEKLGIADVSRARGHNLRTHATNSQLPKSAWFTQDGVVTFDDGMEWNQAVVDKALALSKRKDAVVGISLSLQVGRQEEWRDAPTLDYPHGKPKKPPPLSEKQLMNGAFFALKKEFGAENIVSIVLHYDESTPHVQCVVVPVHDGKLQAKHWLNGAARCAQLLERVHSTFARYAPCTYIKNSGAGGEPHNSGKAAGGPLARQPEPRLTDKIVGALAGRKEIDDLKKRILSLENDVFRAFSAQKHTILELQREKLISADLVEQLRSSKKTIQTQRQEIADLRDQVETPMPEPTPTVLAQRPVARPQLTTGPSCCKSV